MIRLGLTQRVEVLPSYGERRDCLDQNWARFLEPLGFAALPLSNAVEDVGRYVDALGIAGAVLTGGNDLADAERARNIAPERDRFECALIDACMARKLPVLGICRGMQVINHHFQGKLRPLQGHAGTRHRITWKKTPYPDADPSFEIASFHHHGIPKDGLGRGLEALAWAEDETVEAMRDVTGRIHGLMWHPEREPGFAERDMRIFRSVFQAGAT